MGCRSFLFSLPPFFGLQPKNTFLGEGGFIRMIENKAWFVHTQAYENGTGCPFLPKKSILPSPQLHYTSIRQVQRD